MVVAITTIQHLILTRTINKVNICELFLPSIPPTRHNLLLFFKKNTIMYLFSHYFLDSLSIIKDELHTHTQRSSSLFVNYY